jgi:Ca2+-binding RTX toxin-like protein
MIGRLCEFLREVYQLSKRRTRALGTNRSYSATPRFESLEDRRLLAADAIQYDSVHSAVVVVGTSGADQVSISAPSPGTINVQLTTAEGVQTSNFAVGNVTSVVFYGNDGDDYFHNWTGVASTAYGQGGNDVLNGGVGIDTFYGGDGVDSLFGNAGNDVLNGNAGNDDLRGQSGNDTLIGETGDDSIYGSEGDDIVYAGIGNDIVWGGTEDDRIWGQEGNDETYGEAGNDLIYGMDGNDVVYGGDGIDTIEGGADQDDLWGGDGDDVLYAGDGDDEVHGEGGHDRISGGNGNDIVLAGWGDDYVTGDAGVDWIWGEDGDDEIFGGDGDDVIRGNNGNDFLQGDAGNNQLFGQAHDDVLVGGVESDLLFGEEGEDTLYGNDGNDYLWGGTGRDSLFGQAGSDSLSGEDDDDELFGGDGSDYLGGGNGNDLLYGEAGNDLMWGHGGNDTIIGNDGDDLLVGSYGNDLIYGGDGNDIALGGFGDDGVYGQLGNDIVLGDAGADIVTGEDGNDILRGGAGADELDGGIGDDSIWGGTENDFMLAGDGNDVAVGDAGNDVIDGGSGSDLVIGGLGTDTLQGNVNSDIVIGGWTAYDNSLANLQSIMSVWKSSDSYALRSASLQATGFAARLESEVSVFDDGVADTVAGGDGEDWFVLTGTMPVYDPNAHDHEEHDHGDGHHGATIVVDEVPEMEGFDLIDSLDRFTDRQATETMHTKIPHGDDLAKQKEHLALFELVRYDEMTHFAVGDGDWTNASTWADGAVPGDGARVLIPIGVRVTVNGSIAARLSTVRVDGTLAFSTTANSILRADTVVVGGTGTFEMGTATAPIPVQYTARLIITNDGPIDRVRDPFGISRGLISHGTVSMYGAAKSSQIEVVGNLTAGATSVNLSTAPAGWRVGDSIVVTSSVAGTDQNELRTIQSINGSVVSFVQPLIYNHQTPSPAFRLHVANLTRNAIIESESAAYNLAGHVMFMHHRDVDIYNAGFYRLGRTNKLIPINDPVIDANWNLAAGTGTNPRGRYAVHFHRNGSVNDGNPSVIRGSVAYDGASWGFVNHSSYVDISDNVAFDMVGSGFVSEAGDEIGNFTRNIAIGTNGSGEEVNSRKTIQDFGHQGDGFWFQGPGISVTDNVSAGNDGSAFFLYAQGLVEGGVPRTYLSQNLPNPAIAGGAATIAIQYVPMELFTRNIGYSSHEGLTVRYHLRDATHGQQGVFQDSTFWNNTIGVNLPYTHNTILRNLTIVHTPMSEFFGVGMNMATSNIQYDNLSITGYRRGIDLPLRGTNVVNGGYFDNINDFSISNAMSPGRSIRINGPITFGTTMGINQTQVLMFSDPNLYSGSPTSLLNSDSVILNYGVFNNRRVYFALQAASAIPFPTSAAGVPAGYVGKTNQQLWDQFGVAMGGQIAPSNAILQQFIVGLIAAI